MVICNICKGKKVVTDKDGYRPALCPKCKGEGYIKTMTEEKQSKKQLLKG